MIIRHSSLGGDLLAWGMQKMMIIETISSKTLYRLDSYFNFFVSLFFLELISFQSCSDPRHSND